MQTLQRTGFSVLDFNWDDLAILINDLLIIVRSIFSLDIN